MRILYALQGTGNGHTARARTIVPLLRQLADVDVLISGIQSEVNLQFELDYRMYGMSFIFGKRGGVDLWRTFQSLKPLTLLHDIRTVPVTQYDLVINDFEPITAYACKQKGVPCHALSHHAAYLSDKTPRPLQKGMPGFISEWLYKHYAPCPNYTGFHFKPFDSFIRTPVIRDEIRALQTRDDGHITVYLQSYSDKRLIALFQSFNDISFEVFSKHTKTSYRSKNVFIQPIDNGNYVKSLEKCHGLITAGGFESPAEALFLGKKILSVPIVNQYEQFCNVEALKLVGGHVSYRLEDSVTDGSIQKWLENTSIPQVNYPDETASILQEIVQQYA